MENFINEIKPIHPWRFLILLIALIITIFILFFTLNKLFENIQNADIIISFLLGISSLAIFDILKRQWFSPLIKIKSWEDASYLRRELKGIDLYDYILEIENTGNAVAEHCEMSLSIENFEKKHIYPSDGVIKNESEWIPIENETLPWIFLSREEPERFIDINPSAKYKITLARQAGTIKNAHYQIKTLNPQIPILVYLRMYNGSGEEIIHKLVITVTGRNFSKTTKIVKLNV